MEPYTNVTEPKNRKSSGLLASSIIAGILMAALTPIPVVAADGSCTDSDYTGGIGGQTVGCPWTCESPSLITVYVDATDNDAGVSGDATCANGASHCSGLGGCSGEPDRSDGGAGTCKGASQERIDSGLYIQCSSEPADVGPPVDEKICPIVIEPSPPYPRVCIERPVPMGCPMAWSGADDDECVALEPGSPCDDDAHTVLDSLCDPVIPNDPLGCQESARDTLIDPCYPTLPQDPLDCDESAGSALIDPCDPSVPRDLWGCDETSNTALVDLCNPGGGGLDCEEAQGVVIDPVDPLAIEAAAQTQDTDGALCKALEKIRNALQSSASTAHLLVYDGVAFGFVCQGFDCRQAPPTCDVEVTGAFECIIRG